MLEEKAAAKSEGVELRGCDRPPKFRSRPRISLPKDIDSGARTEHQGCLFYLGQQRVQDQRSDFELYLPDSNAPNSN